MASPGFGLYPLRLGMATIFAFTGIEKLTQVEANAAIVSYAGMAWPVATTIALGILEAAIAIAFVLGFMTRTAAALASVLMLAILAALKVPGGFWGDGWGIDVAVLAGVATLALHGPGRPTLASMLHLRFEDPEVALWRTLSRGWNALQRNKST